MFLENPFLDGYCSTVQGLLDWFEVDLGFTELLFIQIDLCVMISRMETSFSRTLRFCTRLYLSRFPYCFAKMISLVLGLIYFLDQMWFLFSLGGDLESTSFVLFCWHELTLRNAVPRKQPPETSSWTVPHWISEKGPERRRRGNVFFFWKVFDTNLRLIRFDFSFEVLEITGPGVFLSFSRRWWIPNLLITGLSGCEDPNNRWC